MAEEFSGANNNERLLAAARTDNEELMQEVFDQGNYDINFQDGLGNTALHYAAASGSFGAMELLLGHDGCDVDLQNRIEGATPLHLALQIDDEDLRKAIVGELLDAGADTTIRNKAGFTPADLVPADGELRTMMRKAQAEARIDSADVASDDDDDDEDEDGTGSEESD